MLRLLFTVLAFLLSVSITAQEQVITYPYNPDVDTDSLIAVPDMLDLLVLFGSEFIPEPVTVDGVYITEWLESASNQCCESLSAVIDSMELALDSIEKYISNSDSSQENMDNIISDILLAGGPHGFQNGEFNYWENMSFTDSAMFVVPENKIMLMVSLSTANLNDRKLIRDNNTYSENDGDYLPLQSFEDIIFKENDTIVFNSQFNSNGNISTVHFPYYLYDNSDNLIEPLYKVLTDSTIYNIPDGKKLIIKNKNYDCANIYINSPNTGVILFSSLSEIHFNDDMSIISGCYCNSCNQCPTFYNCYVSINGYLIDE